MIKTAIIGLGHWGKTWARVLSRLPDVHLRYFCDSDPSTLTQLKDRFGYVNMISDLSPILKDVAIDLAVICTPTGTHYSVSNKLIANGKNVLIEQPVATRAEEARELFTSATKKGVLAFAGHIDEFNPAMEKINRYISTGEIGKPLYCYSQRLNLGGLVADSNPIWEFASHDVYTLLRILDRSCRQVTVKGFHNSKFKQPPVLFVSLDFDEGLLAHLHLSWLDPGKVRKMTVVGEKKMICFDDLSQDAKLTIFDQGFNFKDNNKLGDFIESLAKVRTGDILIPFLPVKEPLMEEAKALISCLRGKTPSAVPPDRAVQVVEILEAAQRSLDNGGLPMEVHK